ncbi:MAG: T9SS type A sorting domain-containing protein, partial [Bacteroidaceae bacterium]|nr:T9SS type A sorting domain-containing protein [Bacteroidaceae bacterium]
KGSEEGKFKFGFDSSTSVPQLVDVDYDLGKTYLVVVGYDFATKVISAWVNPASATAEPTIVLTKQGSISTTNGVQGVCLYQQGNKNIQGKFIVDHVRVATDMASLFKEEGGGGGGEVPELNVTVQSDFTGVAAPINQDTRIMTFTVEAKNLGKPASIWLGGKDKEHYKLSTEEIPAGTGTYEVVLTYHPTAIGHHFGSVNFDAVPTTLSSTHAVVEYAYDPDNLPTITVPAGVDEFKAAPKETDEKTITISSANMFDYVYLAIEDQSTAGAFQLDQGMLLPNGSNEVKISFKPLREGEFKARIKVSSIMVEPQYIELSGVSKGTLPPEPKEGGELVLDKSNPLTYLVENFDDVEHNKPIAKAGWDNVAMEGSRAWWGYKFSDDEEHGSAAKVTPYDSEAEYDTPCEMLLVTPALDFKNAASKVFTCSVMGNFLPSDGTEEVLEVLYIEDKDYMEPLKGLNIPCISDQNKEWVDYVIDFEGQELADVFFIGFRMKSLRGRNNAKTYYVDNVSWGRTDIPQVKADTRLLAYEAEPDKQGVSSPKITVTGLNLTEDIKIKVFGDDAASFTPSVSTLPAAGGEFTLESYFAEEREYVAYIELSSAGSGPFIIEVHAKASKSAGVTNVTVEPTAINAYDLMGRKVINAGTAADVQNLPSGLYIVNGKKVTKK